jgi:hypothetical protein
MRSAGEKMHPVGMCFRVGDLLVTARHNIYNDEEGVSGIKTHQGRFFELHNDESPIKFDSKDLDLIAFEVTQRDWATIGLQSGEVRDARVGAYAMLYGMDYEGKQVSSAGVIEGYEGFRLHHSASSNPGFSGSPLVDKRNCVVGVHIGCSPARVINYAIPLSPILGVVSHITKGEELTIPESVDDGRSIKFRGVFDPNLKFDRDEWNFKNKLERDEYERKAEDMLNVGIFVDNVDLRLATKDRSVWVTRSNTDLDHVPLSGRWADWEDEDTFQEALFGQSAERSGVTGKDALKRLGGSVKFKRPEIPTPVFTVNPEAVFRSSQPGALAKSTTARPATSGSESTDSGGKSMQPSRTTVKLSRHTSRPVNSQTAISQEMRASLRDSRTLGTPPSQGLNTSRRKSVPPS